MVFKKTKYKQKEVGDGPFKKKNFSGQTHLKTHQRIEKAKNYF